LLSACTKPSSWKRLGGTVAWKVRYRLKWGGMQNSLVVKGGGFFCFRSRSGGFHLPVCTIGLLHSVFTFAILLSFGGGYRHSRSPFAGPFFLLSTVYWKPLVIEAIGKYVVRTFFLLLEMKFDEMKRCSYNPTDRKWCRHLTELLSSPNGDMKE